MDQKTDCVQWHYNRKKNNTTNKIIQSDLWLFGYKLSSH